MSQEQTIPEGYMQDSSGRLIPVSLIPDIDIQRHNLVLQIIESAKTLNEAITQFKGQTMGDIQGFMETSAEKYDKKLGGSKGNVTLMSFDGQYKIVRAISEKLVFDERLQIAKELIDKCIHRWTAGSVDEVKALVEHAFQTDKQGKINTARIFSLMKLEIRDPDWKQAMQAIRDSIKVEGSKSYIRIYERQADGKKYTQIPLDIAAI